ncbi:AlpA family transcriptional regulator [Mycobacterium sp. SMC-8]|uniref:helix-turn-helix transcriptional regulator n=1 Tax=Mycobacterium sp. SMC-8 TaxID=2857060 RepID=UPI0021B38E64|nr:helix-turn-helix domain-containing protein [Mycobacterium sp. SMC-8]
MSQQSRCPQAKTGQLNEDRHAPERAGLAKAREVAEYLNTTLNQLSRLRFEGHGPRYVKLGRSVRYRWEDVYAWVDENVQSVGGAK